MSCSNWQLLYSQLAQAMCINSHIHVMIIESWTLQCQVRDAGAGWPRFLSLWEGTCTCKMLCEVDRFEIVRWIQDGLLFEAHLLSPEEPRQHLSPLSKSGQWIQFNTYKMYVICYSWQNAHAQITHDLSHSTFTVSGHQFVPYKWKLTLYVASTHFV